MTFNSPFKVMQVEMHRLIGWLSQIFYFKEINTKSKGKFVHTKCYPYLLVKI